MLPFENRSREADDAFFVDGIHDDILTQLSKVSALRVISRTSVEQFRDTKLPMKAIADQLGVTKILEGGVQRAGDRVRVTVQLIDAATDAHLWAESYDRELTAANIFAIQSEVAAAIADALRASLTAGEQARVDTIPTQNLEAWQAYQLGKQRMASRTSAALSRGGRTFPEGDRARPEVRARLGRTGGHAGAADDLQRPTDGCRRSARPRRPLTRALELDPNLAEAWASAGRYRIRPAAARACRADAAPGDRAQPQLRPAHHWLS